jgi:CRISPR-associated protein Csa3
MEQTTLIATFYSFEPFVIAAHASSPSRIILVIDEEKESDIKVALGKVDEFYGNVAKIEKVKVKGSDLYEISKTTVDLLESTVGRIVVYVGGGKKITSQGVLYGCYARPDLVYKILCNNVNDQTLVELPKLSFALSKAKKRLMEELVRKNGRTVANISEDLKKTRAIVYQHLKELREIGYVDEKFEITMAGRLAML